MQAPTPRIDDYRRCGQTLYQNVATGTYYRLVAYGVSPNGCWLIDPRLYELLDINAGSGDDVYGPGVVNFEYCGTISVRPYSQRCAMPAY